MCVPYTTMPPSPLQAWLGVKNDTPPWIGSMTLSSFLTGFQALDKPLPLACFPLYASKYFALGYKNIKQTCQ